MLCRKPYTTSGGQVHGCGQCMPCRINRRRIWEHRIGLEAQQYDANAFVTLTYSDDKLPEGLTLRPPDVQAWLKKLRSRVAPSRFRFFLVGEYGDESERPHYHAALFGFPACCYGQSRYSERRNTCCYWCDLVRDTWGHGHVFLGTLEADSTRYICGYVTKKMTAKDDDRLGGRYPEFMRCSLRPGIGHSSLWEVADVLMRYNLASIDVPDSLAHGRSKKMLGRYLRSSLRKMVGKDGKAPQETLDAIAAELLPLRLAARSSSLLPSFASQVVEANTGKFNALVARSKIYKKGRSL